MAMTATSFALKTEKATPSVQSLHQLIAADMAMVNHAILSQARNSNQLIAELASHIIAAGGKRLRPALTLACARLCGYEGDRHINLAATVEFIHTATLLHDDVVDDSHLRRGSATANHIWGNKSSILVGDFLLSRAFQMMVSDGSLDVLKILSDAATTISEGEVKQLMIANDPTVNMDDYFEVIAAKTAILFAAACELGAVVSALPELREILRNFGNDLGIAFQLVDDALDYSAREEELGKGVGDDFHEGKVTLPVILAYARGTDEEKAFWVRTMQELDQKPEDLQKAIRLLQHHGTLDATIDTAQQYAERARTNLLKLPEAPLRDALEETIDFCIARAY